jgi:hypothetical protein
VSLPDVQNPPLPRNVGTPLAALNPAPVKNIMFLEDDNNLETSSIDDSFAIGPS